MSIAWAAAAIVVALVIGFIAWLAMGDRAEQTAAPPGTASTAPQPTASHPTAPEPEVAQMMLDLQRPDPEDLLAVGEVDAPVVMIEYADYRCPYCAKFHAEVRPALQELVDDGTLRIEYRDLVIFEEQSQQAAVAARAAAQQDKGADYQTALFARSSAGHAELAREDLLAIAEEVGVPDLAAFEAALDDDRLDALVTADTAEAKGLGISSTPTFLINTAVVQGASDAAHVISVIEQQKELALTGQQS
ncbi:hypothetical protein GCM10011366_27090 [Ornithinimicrobium tianjinense]|uniref:Thioredoxin domain-containing protein n=1 Tax=Ornithinimicrobium tianjinense TaxID=1195761 RepID=A0A917BVH4_9MICO|nr:hypothetical protein GCM10011366_27090 [Ornithinimicrobium tianjinense]